jgi:hypothetical protein
MQTYLKVIFTLFYGDPVTQIDYMSEAEKTQLLNLVYLIFQNDVGDLDFQFGCELIFEYVAGQTINTDAFVD